MAAHHDAPTGPPNRILRRPAAPALARGTDAVARIGGDEFMVLPGDANEPAEAATEQVARNIVMAPSQPFHAAGASCTLDVSMGCVIGNAESSPDKPILRADDLMY